MLNTCLQIPARCTWIQRRPTQSWSFLPNVTAPPTLTHGSNSLIYLDALTPPLTSSACKALASVAMTGRLMWLGRLTGSLVLLTPPFPGKAHQRTVGWVGELSPGVWNSLTGSILPGMEGCLTSCLSQNVSVGLVFCVVSLQVWWRFLRQKKWHPCSPSVLESSQSASTWHCVLVMTTMATMLNPLQSVTLRLLPVISDQ